MANSLEHDTQECSEKLSLEQNLRLPKGIATSMKEKIIVADIMKAKVFDSSGGFLYSLCPPVDDAFLFDTVDVDTDRNGNVYLLVWIANDVHDKPSKKHWYEVFVFDKDEGTLVDAQDIVAANQGHVYVLDKFYESQGKCVHEFSAEKKPLRCFSVDPDSAAITFDRASEHIVIASSCYDPEKIGFHQNVSIYDSNNAVSDDYAGGNLLRSYKLDSVRILLDVSITVNTEGLIAVVLAQDFDGEPRGKLIVMEETTTTV
ncbi:hypothetical protein ACROYT_G023044 [Oculina patagonica]